MERYGWRLAYYVDHHSIFGFVEHHGVHVRQLLDGSWEGIQLREPLRAMRSSIDPAIGTGSIELRLHPIDLQRKTLWYRDLAKLDVSRGTCLREQTMDRSKKIVSGASWKAVLGRNGISTASKGKSGLEKGEGYSQKEGTFYLGS